MNEYQSRDYFESAELPERKEIMKSKYLCGSCGKSLSRQHTEAMLRAGFAKRHLSCPKCGQKTVIERPKGENERDLAAMTTGEGMMP